MIDGRSSCASFRTHITHDLSGYQDDFDEGEFFSPRKPFSERCRALWCRMIGLPEPTFTPGLPDTIKSRAPETPILLHFDVNKTVIHSDVISAKSSEDGIREAVADLFWGVVGTPGAAGSDAAPTSSTSEPEIWTWTGSPPSLRPPDIQCAPGTFLSTYAKYCKKRTGKDKDLFKKSVRQFTFVEDSSAKAEMERMVARAVDKLALPQELLDSTERAEELKAVGLKGSQYFIIPSLFYLVARLQRENHEFGVLFRSFGKDHEKVKGEWNAFCELRHPVFSRLIQDIGPLDGSVPSLPDRRIHNLHTLYRDSEGPVLIVNTFTNGPEDSTWDAWAKAKPKPEKDTRDGRTYIKEVLKAKTVEGIDDLQAWMRSHMATQATSAIKDDWAWWQFHGERAYAGKLLPLIGGPETTRQVFFDDNIDLDDPRIVDCRDPSGRPVSAAAALDGGLCVKVNPVEAVLEDDYFFQKLDILP
jgi:hypothetical protein